MSEKRPYSYTTLRYIHDVVTGEFVNVGLLLLANRTGDSPPYVRFEFKDRIGRIRGLFPDLDREAFQAAIHSIRRRAVSVGKDARDEHLFSGQDSAVSLAHKILPHDGSSLQWSEPGGGVARDLEATFTRILERLVSGYDRKHETRRTDDDVWRPVRQALTERKVAIDFEPQAIRGDVDTIEFKHSWRNGKIHAYEPLSFDLSDADNIKDKARKWMGHLAAAQIGNRDDFQAYFIAGKPSNPALFPAYLNAIEILKKAPSSPEVYEEGEVENLVDLIEDDYRKHIQAHKAP